MLRNLTHLTPVLHNATRWSSKFHMLKRFNEIRDELLQVADTEEATVPIDRSTAFKRNAEKFCKMLREINSITLLLQIGNETLADVVCALTRCYSMSSSTA